ncbi:DUF6233 domain-containing protein [Streptomyces xanthophaeus]|uniref:DUF6233 domain-containing protein n=1 Tax=Streptomyces xanthophaeus TaxID=67385 RepID=UPI00233ECFEA|nr:DUF6233 domain-containing protein [Streptomyces xanthophaeus]WCD91309.1 hypothetical protein KPP03845_200270 [Streptomyces xanthophaeus]
MSVLPPDLPRLRTLVTYLRGELGRAERALSAAEEAEAAAARRRPPLEPPAWLVERGIGTGRPPVRVHAGGCWDTGKRCAPATPEQIRGLLAAGIPACTHCRPDTALGVLE